MYVNVCEKSPKRRRVTKATFSVLDPRYLGDNPSPASTDLVPTYKSILDRPLSEELSFNFVRREGRQQQLAEQRRGAPIGRHFPFWPQPARAHRAALHRGRRRQPRLHVWRRRGGRQRGEQEGLHVQLRLAGKQGPSFNNKALNSTYTTSKQ